MQNINFTCSVLHLDLSHYSKQVSLASTSLLTQINPLCLHVVCQHINFTANGTSSAFMAAATQLICVIGIAKQHANGVRKF